MCVWYGIDTLRRERLLADMRGSKRTSAIRYDVFISYARDAENAKWVERNVLEPLERASKADGSRYRICFDRKTIKVGYSWYSTQVDAICQTAYFIPV